MECSLFSLASGYSSAIKLLCCTDFEYGFANIFPSEQTHKSLRSVVNALCHAQDRLDRAIVDPVLYILLVFFAVLVPKAVVENSESTPGDPLGHDDPGIPYTVLFVIWDAVLRSSATGNYESVRKMDTLTARGFPVTHLSCPSPSRL